MTALDAALEYALKGWPVSPWMTRGKHKFPLTDHGHLDATLNRDMISSWWERWPNAVASIATGERSGIVALDIDVRPDGSGFDILDELLNERGLAPVHPQSPTAHTPQGGCAVLFRWPGRFVKTIAGNLGQHLDIRGDGGSLLLPPGPGRWWDPHLGPDTPLAEMPEWMQIHEPEPHRDRTERPTVRLPLTRYGERALDNAVNRIVYAVNGEQHDTLNREVFAIGGLVAGGMIPSPLALEALNWAAAQMPIFDDRRPWRAGDLSKALQSAFVAGLAHPKRPP